LEGAPAAEIPVKTERAWQWFNATIPRGGENSALYFRYSGGGYVDFAAFDLA